MNLSNEWFSIYFFYCVTVKTIYKTTLFSLSRCQAMQFTTTAYLTHWLTSSYSFERLHLNFVLYIALEKDT